MRLPAVRVIVTLTLLICLICPLVELFDHWDHTVQTGNDTEYALVVLALCVGVAYSLGQFILKPILLILVRQIIIRSDARTVLGFARSHASSGFDATSPPPLPLRI